MSISIAFEDLMKQNILHLKVFYGQLKEKNINKEDYYRGKKLFEYFKCKTFKEYMELYLT